MKAIDTYYHGHYFRSRTEARWSTFYDSLGVKWEYEVDGFDLNGTRYLPDFWLPGLSSYVEIKGKPLTAEETAKAYSLATQSGFMVYAFIGQIVVPEFGPDMPTPATAFFPNSCRDEGYVWCECPMCGHFGIEYDGRTERLKCPCVKPNERMRNQYSNALVSAYRSATTARYEFLDSGGIA